MKKNQNNQNHDEEKSNHPEMNEEHIEVSKDVPNTVEELIDIQDRCRIDFVEEKEIEQLDFSGEIIELDEDKMSKIFKEIVQILHKYSAGPNEDLELSKILLGRIKRFQEFLRKKMQKDKNSPKELLSDISEDIMKMKLILKLLEEGI
jgi:hypothetical protein